MEIKTFFLLMPDLDRVIIECLVEGAMGGGCGEERELEMEEERSKLGIEVGRVLQN